MNLIELQRSLRQLRLGGMAAVLETRLRQAQAEPMAPIDLLATLVGDELTRRADRLLERRRSQAAFRDPGKTLDNFDFSFNPKINRALVFDLAAGAFIDRRQDALFLGPGGTGKSHLAQAIGQAAIAQGHKVLYRETHILLEEVAEATMEGRRKQYMESVSTVALLVIDDFGMRKLPQTAAEDLLEIVMRRYERASTMLTSNRPVEDWGKLLSDVAAAGAMLDRLLPTATCSSAVHAVGAPRPPRPTEPASHLARARGGGPPWKCRAVETLENQTPVSHRSHRPWKSRCDFHIPTADARSPLVQTGTQTILNGRHGKVEIANNAIPTFPHRRKQGRSLVHPGSQARSRATHASRRRLRHPHPVPAAQLPPTAIFSPGHFSPCGQSPSWAIKVIVPPDFRWPVLRCPPLAAFQVSPGGVHLLCKMV
jgi:DNA replication protein DnaC